MSGDPLKCRYCSAELLENYRLSESYRRLKGVTVSIFYCQHCRNELYFVHGSNVYSSKEWRTREEHSSEKAPMS